MNEVAPISLPKVKKDLKLFHPRSTPMEWNNDRVVLAANLPLCFTGATPPRPDPGHLLSVAAGIAKRFGYQPPKINRRLLRRFRRFVQMWLRHHLEPLTDVDIPSLEEWLTSTDYSAERKLELYQIWQDFEADGSKTRLFQKVKSFIKDETYPEYKYPRIINSRIDAAKCFFGPTVQAVSDKLFALPWFIKKIPVPERPAVLKTLLESTGEDEDYVFTDYTAFEAHFLKEIMDVTQFELFKYMLKPCNRSDWLAVYMATVGGINRITLKLFDLTIEATRMSGEMDTSLSNGFANLMLFLFVCDLKNCKACGVVEGDDGLFRCSPAHSAPTEKDFAELGFTIKIGHTKNLSEASFCGQVYDMTDLIVVTDPIEAIARLGWTNKKYVRANNRTLSQLLRARGFSYVYQYNGCPLLSVLGRRLLHLTQGVTIDERIFKNLDAWERAKLRAAVSAKLPEPKEPGIATRQLVSRLYGISVERQLEVERLFANIELGMHQLPCLDLVHKDWIDYFDTYSVNYLNKDPCWLLKPEAGLISRLRATNCCDELFTNLGGG
jgi:hypothetical protein